MNHQQKNGRQLFDTCAYDSNIKCIKAEQEWATKWIEYHEKTTSYPDPPQRIQIETQSP